MTARNIAWLVGMVTFVCVAILGQAELIGEPWRHYIAIGAIVGTAVSGYMYQHPWDGQTERRQERPETDQ